MGWLWHSADLLCKSLPRFARSYNKGVSAGASPRPSGHSPFGRTSDTPWPLGVIVDFGRENEIGGKR